MGYTKVGAGGPSAHAQPPADHAAPSPGKRNTGHKRRMLTCPCRQRRQIAAATHTTEAICGPGPEDAYASTPRPLPTPVLVILQGVRYSLLAAIALLPPKQYNRRAPTGKAKQTTKLCPARTAHRKWRTAGHSSDRWPHPKNEASTIGGCVERKSSAAKLSLAALLARRPHPDARTRPGAAGPTRWCPARAPTGRRGAPASFLEATCHFPGWRHCIGCGAWGCKVFLGRA